MNEPISVVTSCYGERFWSALPAWAAHIDKLTPCSIEVVSLDGSRYRGEQPNVSTIMARLDSGKAPTWGAGDRFRLLRVLSHLSQGKTAAQIDIDVKLKCDFSPLARMPYDFIISRAFAFPEVFRDQLGFVACSGFYIAKPASLPFCFSLFENIVSGAFKSELDQFVLNAMLCEAAHRKESVSLDGLTLAMDVFDVCGSTVGVLPEEIIARRPTDSAVFGNHFPQVIDEFIDAGLFA